MLAAWGRFVFRHRVLVLLACVVVLVLGAVGLARGGVLTTGTLSDLESTKAAEAAQKALGDRAGPAVVAVFRSDALTVDDPDFYESMGKSLAPLEHDAHVASVLSPVEAPTRIGDALVSADKHAAIALITMRGSITDAKKAFPALREEIKPQKDAAAFKLAYTGEVKYRVDLDDTLKSDLFVSELVSLPLALLVLLVVFRSAVAATLPVVVGALAVLSAIACILQLSHFTDMPEYTLNVASLIGLGLAIDYSLFYTSRFREELAREETQDAASVERAIEKAMATAGHAVLGSGLAAAVGISGLLFFKHSYMSSMGIAGAVVVVFSVASALTLLPAALAILGKRVDAGAIGKRKHEDGWLWRKIVPRVMAHPIMVLVPTLAIVVALGLPFLRIDTASAFVGVLPMKTEARATYERVLSDFPAQSNNRILVVVKFPSTDSPQNELTLDRIHALRALRDRIAKLPGIVQVDSLFDFDPTLSPDEADKILALPEELRAIDVKTALEHLSGGGVHIMMAQTKGAPRTPEARNAVRAIRMDRSVGDGTLLVGGLSAVDVDTNAFFAEHTPAAVSYVAILTYVILFFLFRSVVLPLKAVITNLLSIAASFGALVWIFQEGHFAKLLGFEPGPVEPTLPVLLFCVVFGLSMDYEVLLLSRIREEYLATGDNARAVTEGLARSGRLITSAAAIMVSVFAAFSLASVVMMKAMGVGMAIAVTLDATLVRTLLVPAAMRLFGDFNWWPSRRT
jgi:RND superfamily putative drug exporter